MITAGLIALMGAIGGACYLIVVIADWIGSGRPSRGFARTMDQTGNELPGTFSMVMRFVIAFTAVVSCSTGIIKIFAGERDVREVFVTGEYIPGLFIFLVSFMAILATSIGYLVQGYRKNAKREVY